MREKEKTEQRLVALSENLFACILYRAQLELTDENQYWLKLHEMKRQGQTLDITDLGNYNRYGEQLTSPKCTLLAVELIWKDLMPETNCMTLKIEELRRLWKEQSDLKKQVESDVQKISDRFKK